jgi:hypothetical protein
MEWERVSWTFGKMMRSACSLSTTSNPLFMLTRSTFVPRIRPRQQSHPLLLQLNRLLPSSSLSATAVALHSDAASSVFAQPSPELVLSAAAGGSPVPWLTALGAFAGLAGALWAYKVRLSVISCACALGWTKAYVHVGSDSA